MKMGQKERYGTISAVSTGSGVLGAAECEGRVGEDHRCSFIHRAVEHMDRIVLAGDGEEGGARYCFSGADVEGVVVRQRGGGHVGAATGGTHREDPGLRYLAGGARPDNWTECVSAAAWAGSNDVFTQVLEMARPMKRVRLGQVAIDSTPIQAAGRGTRWKPRSGCGRSGRGRGGAYGSGKSCAMRNDPNEGAARGRTGTMEEESQAMTRRRGNCARAG